MGERGNIVVGEPHGGFVFLYTQWRGLELPAILQQVLARRQRWADAPYLARLIFQRLTGPDDTDRGFGISTHLTDNQFPILMVDVRQQKVRLFNVDLEEVVTWTFEQFVQLDIERLPWVESSNGGLLDGGQHVDQPVDLAEILQVLAEVEDIEELLILSRPEEILA